MHSHPLFTNSLVGLQLKQLKSDEHVSQEKVPRLKFHHYIAILFERED
jgi:hypothetical protein